MANNDMITTQEAAALIGRHPSILSQWRRDRKPGVPMPRKSGRGYVYSRADVLAYREAHAEELDRNKAQAISPNHISVQRAAKKQKPAPHLQSSLSPDASYISDNEMNLRQSAILAAMDYDKRHGTSSRPDDLIDTAKTIYHFLKNPV